ncbi:hypothetical protein AHiyo8_12910 [Arthrobacter sp. Hiyo8]|nr:hypothetical protein AHiyo8_12910 [Arthrobacter sp. Hiyo8]
MDVLIALGRLVGAARDVVIQLGERREHAF